MSIKKVLKENYGQRENCVDFNLSDFIHAFGNAKGAILYSALFMPELTVIEDCILLKDAVENEEERLVFLESLKTNRIEDVEASYNFIEIGFLFRPSGRNSSDEEDTLLAHRIRDAWEGWLKLNFPDRRFVIEVLSPEETGSTVGVHFFQKRNG